MDKEKHIKKVKRYWIEENEEENYRKYIDDYNSEIIQLVLENIISDKEIYLFYKLIKEVDKEFLFKMGQIPCHVTMKDINPISNYVDGKINYIKLNKYISHLSKDITSEDFFYIAYLDYKYNFSLNDVELSFILRASRYDDIIYNYTYEKLLGKNLDKGKLYKAGILINTYDISYKDLEKYIFDTQIGKTYLSVDEIKAIGAYISSGQIDEVIEEIYKIYNLNYTGGSRNENGVYTSLDEVDKIIISKYENPKKIGSFIGKLKFRVWGNNKSLICFFETNEKEYIKLHAWYRETGVYTPRDSDINFSEVKDDTLWMLTIGQSKTNNLYWDKAEKIWDQ